MHPILKFNGLFLLEGDYGAAIFYILALMAAPAIILILIGLLLLMKYKKAAKVCFILAAIYVLVGLGICSMM